MFNYKVVMMLKFDEKNVKKSEKMRSPGTPCKSLDFGPFSGGRKKGSKSRFFL